MAWSISLGLSESNVSVVNNTSVVTATLYVSWNYGSWAADNPSYNITIDGTTYSGTANFNTGGANSGSQVVASHSKTVTHNSDGSKTVSASAGYAGTGSGWQTASASKTLTVIPRVSSLAVNKTSVVANNSDTVRVTVTKKLSSYTDTLVLTLGNKSQTISLSGSGTSYSGSFKVPENWSTQISGTSATGVLTLTTKSGNTTIGTTTSNITIQTKSYTPSVSVALSPIQPSGYPASFPDYTQNLSKVNCVVTASGYQGSTISSTSVIVDNIEYEGSNITSDFLLNSGTITITALATDSRGITGTATRTISAVSYYTPLLSVTASTSIAENKSTIKVISDIAPVNNVNAKTYVLYGTWTDEYGNTHTEEQIGSGTIANYSSTFNLYHTGIDPTNTYVYKVKIQDSYTYNTYEASTGVICISRKSGGKGVTLGKEATEDGFNCYFNAKFYVNNTLRNLVDLIYPVGSIYMSVNSTSPQTIFGGTWEQVKDTFLLSAGDTYTAGDTGGSAVNDFSNKLHYAGLNYRMGDGGSGSYSERLVVGIGDQTRGSDEQNYTPFEDLNNMPPYLAVYMWKRTA